MKHVLREAYQSKKPVVGTFFSIGDMSSMECLGYTGLDFVIIDTEHGPFDTETMMNLIRAAESVGLVPLVRIADVTHREIQRAADCGAQGLIVPCLREVEEYRKLVELAKFPPVGKRGFMKCRGCGFGYQDWAAGSLEDFMAASNDRLMVIPQCETVESLEHIEEIAALPGVDGIFIGPFDLSISMGMPGRFQDPAFTAALDRIITAFHGADKPAYIYTNDPAEARRRIAAGVDGVANSVTAIVLTEAYRKITADIRGGGENA